MKEAESHAKHRKQQACPFAGLGILIRVGFDVSGSPKPKSSFNSASGCDQRRLAAAHGKLMPAALIIGTGPAGLFCAQALASAHWPGSVTVIERGTRFDERFLSRTDWEFDPDAVLCGEGGAGFLADAKLCLSSDAGNQFEDDLAAQYPRALQDIDFHVYQHLLDLGHEIRRAEPNRHQLHVVRRRLSDLALELDTYPVRPLGSDMAAAFLRRFVGNLQNRGVAFVYNTEAKTIAYDRAARVYRVTAPTCGTQMEYECTHLFLAVGWAGSAWLRETGSSLGLEFTANNLDIGVRLEFPTFGGHQLKEAGDNPKIKFYDGHSYSKTHCLVHAGRAFSFNFLDHHFLVDAHAVRRQPTRASSVNFLYRIRPEHIKDPLQVFRAVSASAREYGQNRPLVMALTDFLEDEALPSSDSSFEPTMHAAVECDLSLVLPGRVANTIREHIRQLARFAPGIATREAVIYAPAAQWVMPRVKLGRNFIGPDAQNLYCIGDCTGLTAGVLPAAVSGVVAARDAVARLTGDLQLPLWSFP